MIPPKHRRLLFLLLLTLPLHIAQTADTESIHVGFTATHDPSYAQFQPLLSDPTALFSLGFLRADSAHHLNLAVIHLPSSFPLWRAPAVAPWTAPAFLAFNGSLLLFDNSSSPPHLLWSTDNRHVGDRLLLLNSSNLQISDKDRSTLWQSFDSPSDTLVQSQDLGPNSTLSSLDRNFTMRLGPNYMGLYMGRGSGGPVIYWKHTALQAKARIVDGGGEIHARIEEDGFLAMYQSAQSVPVDVLPFDSFNRGIRGFRRLTLGTDGNLRAYYWNGTVWSIDFTAIAGPCGLPTLCGPYGLCSVTSAGAQRCDCLLDSDDAGTGSVYSEQGEQERQCASVGRGLGSDLCGRGGGEYQVVRRQGVDLLIDKELVPSQKVGSVGECEGSCESNCSCWGVVYNNATGYCYSIDYPVETLVEGDDKKLAYLKVVMLSVDNNNNKGRSNETGGRGTKTALLILSLGVLVGCAAFGAFRVWQWRRQQREDESEDHASSLPYKNLRSASFRSIELSGVKK